MVGRLNIKQDVKKKSKLKAESQPNQTQDKYGDFGAEKNIWHPPQTKKKANQVISISKIF